MASPEAQPEVQVAQGEQPRDTAQILQGATVVDGAPRPTVLGGVIEASNGPAPREVTPGERLAVALNTIVTDIKATFRSEYQLLLANNNQADAEKFKRGVEQLEYKTVKEICEKGVIGLYPWRLSTKLKQKVEFTLTVNAWAAAQEAQRKVIDTNTNIGTFKGVAKNAYDDADKANLRDIQEAARNTFNATAPEVPRTPPASDEPAPAPAPASSPAPAEGSTTPPAGGTGTGTGTTGTGTKTSKAEGSTTAPATKKKAEKKSKPGWLNGDRRVLYGTIAAAATLYAIYKLFLEDWLDTPHPIVSPEEKTEKLLKAWADQGYTSIDQAPIVSEDILRYDIYRYFEGSCSSPAETSRLVDAILDAKGYTDSAGHSHRIYQTASGNMVIGPALAERDPSLPWLDRRGEWHFPDRGDVAPDTGENSGEESAPEDYPEVPRSIPVQYQEAYIAYLEAGGRSEYFMQLITNMEEEFGSPRGLSYAAAELENTSITDIYDIDAPENSRYGSALAAIKEFYARNMDLLPPPYPDESVRDYFFRIGLINS